MSLRVVPENTGWEIALAIAVERENNVQRLINAVLTSDFAAAQILAEELLDDEEGVGITPSLDRRAGH